jgi:hypothetical protein
MTRSDVHIGNNRNFNQTLSIWCGCRSAFSISKSWQDLEQLTELGDDGPDGPATVFNLQTLIEMQRQNLARNQVLDLKYVPR